MSKILIRDIEEELPTISDSLAKMAPIEKLSVYLIYHHAKKFLTTVKPYGRILEIGCGDGLFLNEIQNALGANNCEYVGIDISRRKLRCAWSRSQRLKITQKTHFILADAEHLPFKTSIFDIAIMIEVLEHFPAPVDCITELTAVIVQSGKIIITTPSAYGAKGDKVSVLKRLIWPMKYNDPILRETYTIVQGIRLPHRDFTFDEINGLFSRSFELLNIHSFNFGIHVLMKRIFPQRFIIWLTGRLESSAAIFPKTWGHNWLILCEKKDKPKR
jgi:ubiquinone/menaquinone biosynthesis C-methylase UbiE